jgi:hypothetical protein
MNNLVIVKSFSTKLGKLGRGEAINSTRTTLMKPKSEDSWTLTPQQFINVTPKNYYLIRRKKNQGNS